MLRPWNAAALPEIMAGALQESKRGVPVQLHEGRAAGQQSAVPEACAHDKAVGQQPGSVAGARGRGMWKPSNVAEARGGGAEKPSRGLTLRLTGGPKARPS